ncbi:MAG: hypothetical protein U1G07_19690 [Verrucomicrobiota bacterium]
MAHLTSAARHGERFFAHNDLPPHDSAASRFAVRMAEARTLLNLHRQVKDECAGREQVIATGRAALLSALSALDRFIRERLIDELTKRYLAKEPELGRARPYAIDLRVLQRTAMAKSDLAWIGDCIHESFASTSFLSSDAVADGLKYLKNGSFWAFAALALGASEEQLRDQLDRLIRHTFESGEVVDLDEPSFPLREFPGGLDEAIGFVKRLAECIGEYLWVHA